MKASEEAQKNLKNIQEQIKSPFKITDPDQRGAQIADIKKQLKKKKKKKNNR
jgi:hypothetical protein